MAVACSTSTSVCAGGLRDVSLHGHRPFGLTGDHRNGFIGRLLILGKTDGHPRTVIGEHSADGTANSAPAAGHDGRPVFKDSLGHFASKVIRSL
jgi:hypothetical protein